MSHNEDNSKDIKRVMGDLDGMFSAGEALYVGAVELDNYPVDSAEKNKLIEKNNSTEEFIAHPADNIPMVSGEECASGDDPSSIAYHPLVNSGEDNSDREHSDDNIADTADIVDTADAADAADAADIDKLFDEKRPNQPPNLHLNRPSQSPEYYQVLPGQQLTTKEAIKLCKILDPDSCPGKVSKRTTERILNKVTLGGAALDHTEGRFRFDPLGHENPADPAILTVQEMNAVIAIQSGKTPKCSRTVVESALKKFSSGQFVDMNQAKPAPRQPADQGIPLQPADQGTSGQPGQPASVSYFQRITQYLFEPPSRDDIDASEACVII